MKLTMEINSPIFIVGVPHSGNSWLGKILGLHPKVVNVKETNYIWMWGNSNKPNDVLKATDLTSRIETHIKNRVVNHLNISSNERLCDKTPRNCLRIPFLHALFPDAKFILVIRDGRGVIRSIQRQNVKPSNEVMRKEIFYRLKNVPITDLSLYLPRAKWIFNRLMGKSIDYWGVRPPGWQDWVREYSQPVVIAKQWVEANAIAREDGKNLLDGSFLEIRYEDLILNPGRYIAEVTDFLGLNDIDLLMQCARETADPQRVHRWKETLTEDVLAEVKPYLETLLYEMGYNW
jgi:hypothetical protein